MKARLASLVALSMVCGSHMAGAQPETFTVVPEQSSTIVEVYKSGVLSAALHDHHFHAEKWSGSFVFDLDHPESVHGTVVIDAASLRDRQPELSQADEAKVNAQTQGPDVLDAAKYPTITFSFDHLEIVERKESTVRGNLVGSLTLHGQTHAVRVPIASSYKEHRLHAVGTTGFKMTDFGIKPPSKALGAIGVKDYVEVKLDIIAAVK